MELERRPGAWHKKQVPSPKLKQHTLMMGGPFLLLPTRCLPQLRRATQGPTAVFNIPYAIGQSVSFAVEHEATVPRLYTARS